MRRALIVGAGGSGFLHALALRSAGVSIAAVVDPNRERAEWLAGLTSARAEHVDDVDVVAICSPPSFHVAQAEAFARPDRLVFVEKPIAVNDDELARLAALPNIVPVLQWRAGRSARALKAAFAQGLFGPRPRIRCELCLWRDADYFAARTDWGCGAMLSIGIHAIDLVLWMVGQRVLEARRTERVVTEGDLAIVFDDGTTAEIRITLDAHGRNDFRLTVRGDEVSAELSGSEEDPTASPLKWRGASPPTASGATGSPLLVPFIHEALRGPSVTVADVAEAHALAFSEALPPRDLRPSDRPRPADRCAPG